MTTPKKPATPQQPQSPAAEPPLRILKKATCPTLSEKSTLTYAVACDHEKALHLQITANTGGGFFSQEWIPLKRIQQVLKECAATKAITSICLWPLFRGQSVNTRAFLLAVLRAEKLVRPLPGRQRVHELCDPADFQARMDKLVASDINLPDDPAKAPPKPPNKSKPRPTDPSSRKPTKANAKKLAAKATSRKP
jgi:hypothetical protein